MSTLRVNTLQNTAGTGQPAMVGAAKAWVNFNGTGTVAIRAAFNVSSITDNGTGDYTVNFTTAMVDANYGAVAMSDRGNAGGATLCINIPTTSSLRVSNFNDSGNPADGTYPCIAIFR